jgi:hypothetical protein
VVAAASASTVIYVRTFFQATCPTRFIDQSIVDPNLLIKFVGLADLLSRVG